MCTSQAQHLLNVCRDDISTDRSFCDKTRNVDVDTACDSSVGFVPRNAVIKAHQGSAENVESAANG